MPAQLPSPSTRTSCCGAPLAFTAEQKSDDKRHSNNYWNVGRLRPGATLDQAQAQVDALNAANLERFPQYKELLVNAGFHTKVERFQDRLVKHVKPTLYLLWGGALFVLSSAASTSRTSSLVRARSRLKELATRLALGAGRGSSRASSSSRACSSPWPRPGRAPAGGGRAARAGCVRPAGPALRLGDPPRRRGRPLHGRPSRSPSGS